jgi:rSAM/selenodomain-associated transferase 1
MTLSLALFAKAPVLGATKTRLQPALGESGALDAHCRLVEHALWQITLVSAMRSELWISAEHPFAQSWSARFALPWRLQEGADLGLRMDHALQDQLSRGASFAFVMGCDCPSIDADYLNWVAGHCGAADVIIAPAEDGGYGLIGLARPQPELFSDMPWGTGQVYGETLRRAQLLGLRIVVGASIWDVDRPEDWTRFEVLRAGKNQR